MNSLQRYARKYRRGLIALGIVCAIGLAAFSQPLMDRYQVATGHLPSHSYRKYAPGTLLKIKGDDLPRTILVKILNANDDGVHLRPYAKGSSIHDSAEKREFIIGSVPLSSNAWSELSTVKKVGYEDITKDERASYFAFVEDPAAMYWDSLADAGALMNEPIELTEEVEGLETENRP